MRREAEREDRFDEVGGARCLQARYRETRPKVERKIAHLMRRKHSGRRARMRGRLRIAHGR